MIHIIYGDGKGKTCAAAGMAARAAGHRKYVLFVQFMKHGVAGEIKMLSQMEHVTVLNNPMEHGFSNQLGDDEKAALTQAHNHNLADALACARGGRLFMIVCDELMSALEEDLVDKDMAEALLGWCAGHKDRLELVLTGRRPTQSMLDAGDYVTELKEVRHPYHTGLAAREGVEY